MLALFAPSPIVRRVLHRDRAEKRSFPDLVPRVDREAVEGISRLIQGGEGRLGLTLSKARLTLNQF